MSDWLRVAMIIQRYYPHIGGAERQLAALAPLLHQHGVELQILTRRYPGLLPYECIDGVPVHRLPIPGPKAIASVSFTLSALARLRQLKPDIIHAHELLSPATTAVVAKRLWHLPVVAKVLNSGKTGDLDKLRTKWLGTSRLATFRKHIDAFVTISQEIDSELDATGIPAERRWYIPNGVDSKRYRPVSPAEQEKLRVSLGLPQGPIVLFMGRFVAQKCIGHLLSAWPAVRVQYPTAQLVLLGTGEEEKRLKQQASPGVHFTGPIDDVVPYLQAADLFVLPSATEGLSNALLEALSTRLPVIATKISGTEDVIDHSRNGWLIPPGDISALEQAMCQLLGDESLRHQLGRQGRTTIQDRFTLSVTARRLRELYDEVTQPSSSV